MPYISQERRDQLRTVRFDNPERHKPQTPGELNYLVTNAMLTSVSEKELKDNMNGLIMLYQAGNPKNYQTFNDIFGAFVMAQIEYERRTGVELDWSVRMVMNGALLHLYDDVIGPYEDRKIEENGDVYPENIRNQFLLLAAQEGNTSDQ